MSTATLNEAPTATPAASPFAGTAAKGGSFDLCPAGNHPATLVAIFDLGTHDGEYQGQVKPDERRLYLAWEIPGEIKPNGDPHVIGKDYTVMVSPSGKFEFGESSNIRKMLEGWRNKKYSPDEPIDPGMLLGKSCLVNVTHSSKGDKTYHNLDKVSSLPKGMPAPERAHEPVAFHISMGEPPAILWLPKIYHRASGKMEVLEEVARASKERTGQPIGKGGKPKDTPYSEAIKPSAAPKTAATEDDDIPF